MLTQEKIGIIGLGFVGNAIQKAYEQCPYLEIVEIDTNPELNCFGTYEELDDASAVFVCVPSPTDNTGKCDASILISVLEKLQDYKGVIISKVTATPDIYKNLQEKYPNLVHSPEFLTAANAVNDYIGSTKCIIGGKIKAYTHEAHRIIKLGQPNLDLTYFCSIEEASFAKYVINTFLATKVVFMNEMAALAKEGGQNWELIRNLIALDGSRIGNSHTQVPGFDGQLGFGGHCFSKDTQALLTYAKDLNVQLNVLDSAVKKNLLLRLTNSK